MPRIFIPMIEKEELVADPATLENELFIILKYSPYQQRKNFSRNLLLDKAARQKVDDMEARDYFSHTSPDGVTANQNVRSVGYELPGFYPQKGNNVESLCATSGGPLEPDKKITQLAADAWYGSDHHRAHVYGQESFYRNQGCVGIGIAVSRKDKHLIYAFITAPCT